MMGTTQQSAATTAIPDTWSGLFVHLAKGTVHGVQRWYGQWIKALVMNRVKMLAEMEEQCHGDTFGNSAQIMYGNLRPTETQEQSAAKQAWGRVQYTSNPAQHHKLKQQMNDMYMLQHRMQQQLRNRNANHTSPF